MAEPLHQSTGETIPVSIFQEKFDSAITKRITQHFDCSMLDAQQLQLELALFLEQENTPKTAATHWVSVDQFLAQKGTAIWKAMKQNFGLSAAGFEEVLIALRKGNDELFEHVFLRHFDDCMRFLQQQFDAKKENAYDASMDAMLVFCERLTEGKIKYGNLRFLFTQIARQIYVRAMKKGNKQNLTNEFDAPLEEEKYDKNVFIALEKALAELCKDCTQLLTDNYHNNLRLNEIATLMQKTPASIRKQKQRCLEKLRNYFKKYYRV